MNFLKKISWKDLPVFPFLIGIFPVLYLWNANRAQEPAYVVIPSLVVTIIGIAVIYGVVLAISRNAHRAGLITAVLSFYILTYGQYYNLVEASKNALLKSLLFPVTMLIVIAIIVQIAISKWGSPASTRILNLISAVLVVFQVVSAAPYYMELSRMKTVSAKSDAVGKKIPVTGLVAPQPQRDVYFIILDNYGRQDILKSGSNFDNSELVNALKQRGFSFPDCATGNYISTAPVISSILNMNYLDDLGVKDKSFIERGHYGDMAPLMQESAVINKFRAYGYHIVTFRGFMGLIDIQDSDTYISFDKDKDYTQRLETAKFQDLYFETTIFAPLNKEYKIYPDWIKAHGPDFMKKMIPDELPLAKQFAEVYQQNIYSYDALARVPIEVHSPKFVYAHLYGAHWPFMMNPDGTLHLPFTQEQTVEGYVRGVEFTNNRILSAIDSILANSKVPPVIILQGDHSNEWTRPVEWSGKDRLKILSAYYLPDGGEKMLYDSISPVNNFRLVFQKYFGEADMSLLPDKHFYLDPRTRQLTGTLATCISGGTEESKK